MITRRQFLTGCAGAFATVAGLSFLPGYKLINGIVNSIPVLLYHRVGPETDPLTITPDRFQNDLELLSQEGYTTLSLAQLKQHIQKTLTEPLPAKPLVVTFDDGYLDNYTNAFPILQLYSMKASFYIITGMVGLNDRMTGAHIREMENAGMDFGSHTVTHRSLAELKPGEVKTELYKSKSDLEQIVGKAVDFIAYPGGSYTPAINKVAQQAGYIGGYSVNPGFAMFKDCMAIRRIPIFHYDRSIAYIMIRKGFLPDLLS